MPDHRRAIIASRNLTITFAAAALLACSAVVGPAAIGAPLVFTLQGVAFTDGGTAVGSFTFDPDTSAFAAYNITTTNGLVGSSYAGTHYTPSYAAYCGRFFYEFHSDVGGYHFLALFVANNTRITGPGVYPLAAGTVVAHGDLAYSGEFVDAAGDARAVSVGSLVVTPANPVPSATPTPPSPPALRGRASIRAVVVNTSGAGTASPVNYDGVFQRVGVLPGQSVTITLLLPVATLGERILVRAVDGGVLTAQMRVATAGPVSNAGTGTYTFSGSAIEIPATINSVVNGYNGNTSAAVSVSFQYQVAGGTGAFRLYVNAGPDEALLRFWVQDPLNPNKRPDIIPAYLPP